MYNSQHTVYTSNGIENQKLDNIFEQLDGNISISSSSVATEPQCECCDGQPECVSTTSTYDPVCEAVYDGCYDNENYYSNYIDNENYNGNEDESTTMTVR